MSEPYFSINSCRFILVLIFLFYSSPMWFDMFPSSDSYLGGTIFGLWGIVILLTIGIVLSITYGLTCVSKKTVYRCIDGPFGLLKCDKVVKDNNLGLIFPEEMEPSFKQKYIDNLKNVDKDWYTHHPFSKFNKTLKKLNNEYLYEKKLTK